MARGLDAPDLGVIDTIFYGNAIVNWLAQTPTVYIYIFMYKSNFWETILR